jgi:tetratricopeptide (TPR) repeat protein/CHAT domain-containing protein
MVGSELDEIERLRAIIIPLFHESRFDEATGYARKAVDMARRNFGGQPVCADTLHILASLLYQSGSLAEAEPLFREAIEINREVIGENQPQFAENLNNLAVLCYRIGKVDEAESLYRQALEIRRATVGEGSPAFAATLNNLAKLYEGRGDFENAEALLKQALEIVRNSVIEEGPQLARALLSLGELYKAKGDLRRAEPLVRQATEIMERSEGKQHPEFASYLSNLGSLYKGAGKYQEAERQYLRAREIIVRSLGREHPVFAAIASRLSELYQEQGDYDKAESCIREAEEAARQIYGEQTEDYASALSNRATLCFQLGDYDAAERLFRQALEIKRSAVGEHHPAFARGLRNLAMALDVRRTTESSYKAEQLYQQALNVLQETVGDEHADYANCLNDLGVLFDRQRRYGEAVRYYRQARDAWLRVLGASGLDHPSYAMVLNNLGGAYDSMGIYPAVEQYYAEALEVMGRIWGESHPSYAGCLKNLAGFYVATDRALEAIPMMQRALQVYDRLIGQVFSFTSESQKMAYLKSLEDDLYSFLSLVLYHAPDSASAKGFALDMVLRRKGIVAESMALQQETLLQAKYPDLRAGLEELTSLRMDITRKSWAGPEGDDVSTHEGWLKQQNARKESLEAEMARQIPEMNLSSKLRHADRSAVSMALPADMTLIEFVRFDVFDFRAVPIHDQPRWNPAHYMAFVLPARAPDRLQMIDLGEAGPIDQLIASFRSAITGEDEGDRNRGLGSLPSQTPRALQITVGVALREMLFDPLSTTIGNHKGLLIAPDGDLTRLPFEVLPIGDRRCLIDDYRISYVASGRDVLRFGAASSGKANDPLVAADPDFDLSTGNAHHDTRSKGIVNDRQARVSRDLDGMYPRFERLPGTRLEGEQIARLLNVEPRVAGEALESHLKTLHSPRILHLATHGFFLADQTGDPKKDQHEPQPAGWETVTAVSRLSRIENPLLRSGLALAGANTWLNHGPLPPEAEDGILTAEDVSGLDLLATELAVLSACETGLGEVRTGEGVFGLRRAFMLAGAKTLVLSLWKVPDKQTQELMVDFYQQILSGAARGDALREAQLRLKEKHPEPLYWGAFICQGDPGPLAAA